MASLYIHIPFCVARCNYCDFHSNTCLEYKDSFISALLREMDRSREDWQDHKFDTIYFGGGTPSLIPPKRLSNIFTGIYSNFAFSVYPEITLEANPDDLSSSYIDELSYIPVNRISMGVQSFDDRELRLLNRRHSAQQAIDAIVKCQAVDLTNINIDLMFGLPGQTAETWSQTIDRAIDLRVSHISAYNLTYEEGTDLYRMKQNGEINPVDDDVCAQFYSILTAKLAAAGFVHYEISNFARRSTLYPSGRISFHNVSYWNGTHYLGLGPSAHSFKGTSRSWNVSSLTAYINGASCETEPVDERAAFNDFIITRLRTMWGVSLRELRRRFGKERENDFLEKCEQFVSINKLKKEVDNVKVLPEFYFVSDAILRELIV